MMPSACRAIVPILMVLLVACTAPGSAGPATAATPAPAVTNAAAPPAEQPTLDPAPSQPADEPTPVPSAVAAPLSFHPTTYRDEVAGFELDYPSEWTLDPASQIGVRGGQALLLSPGTTTETLAEGGSRVSITTYIWDPKNHLDAYVAQRKLAWDASGFAIMQEEQWQLADGRPAYVFVVKMPEQPVFTLFTTVGEDYLQVSVDGDTALAEEIARTLRPLD